MAKSNKTNEDSVVATLHREQANALVAYLKPPEFIRKAMSLGVAKVNTDSDLRLAALGRLRQVVVERPDIFNLYELMGEIEAAIRDAVAARIHLLGSDGKARS
jgi:fructose/tagatose bisphosphate aldolase